MRIRPTLVAGLTALLSASVVAGPAAALQPGVTINPSSPAGKEYSFPLDVLRGAATGHTAPQGVAQPLFGVGIGAVRVGQTTPGRGRKFVAAAGRFAGATSPTRGGAGTGSRSARSAAPGSVPERELASLIRPRSSTTQVVLLALVALLAGLVAGVAMVAARRRS